MIEVLQGGLQTLIQDVGRAGYRHFGVPISGAMDCDALRIGNWLVGNPSHTAVIEMTMTGASLKFETHTFIAVTGAHMNACLNGKPIQRNETVAVERGAILTFGKLEEGFRTYLSVAGGFQIGAFLNSMSTYLYASIGGVNGKSLQKGDKIPIVENREVALRKLPDGFLKGKVSSLLKVRVLPGIEYNLFTEASRNLFFQREFQIHADSNRMGYRLSGPLLKNSCRDEMLSSGIVSGTIQVPENGNPIILLADSQTTGGYPRIANVASVDIPYLAQQKPGDKIRFQKISLQEAQALCFDKEKKFRSLLDGYLPR
jgi:antagonist of KipI